MEVYSTLESFSPLWYDIYSTITRKEAKAMKYKTDSLQDVYIHDTNLDQFGYQGDECIFIVSEFCIKHTCNVNTNPHDMQVKEGLIRFKGIDFKEMCYRGYKEYDKDDRVLEVVVDRYIDPYEIDSEISNMIDLCPQLYSCDSLDNGDYVFTILCEREVIQLILGFESVSIQWNDYDGKAWYVNRP